MKRLFSPYWLWVLFALPMAGLLWGIMAAPTSEAMTKAVHNGLHPAGEFAARFLIVAMMATPLVRLLPGWRGPRWLVRNRRYFGVASFAYAAVHTVFYVMDAGTLAAVVGDIPKTYIWTGWGAFVIFLPLAATSMDLALRKMGPKRWKALQRWTYGAAVLTLIHWAALVDWAGLVPALVQFSPVIALSVWRVMQSRSVQHA